MVNCTSCSAPLSSNINRCKYCNVRNDIDLHSKHPYAVTTHQSDRICPHCDEALQTITLNLKKPFEIDRCKSCFGLFFDPGEINILLESSVSNIFDINLELITNINKDRYKKNKKFTYIKCPVCFTLMNRVNFGHRSGVIIDQCIKHGIWTDSGEITHLMEWKKAGGELLHKKNQKQEKKKKRASTTTVEQSPDYIFRSQQTNVFEADLLTALSSLVYKLFT